MICSAVLFLGMGGLCVDAGGMSRTQALLTGKWRFKMETIDKKGNKHHYSKLLELRNGGKLKLIINSDNEEYIAEGTWKIVGEKTAEWVIRWAATREQKANVTKELVQINEFTDNKLDVSIRDEFGQIDIDFERVKVEANK
jgi:hypothetical protein